MTKGEKTLDTGFDTMILHLSVCPTSHVELKTCNVSCSVVILGTTQEWPQTQTISSQTR